MSQMAMKDKINRKLLSVEDCDLLDISNVHQIYRKNINSSRVDLLSSFDFGKELVSHSEGCFIYTKCGKKILDFTGGIGVLNHGHNHPRILNVRKRFSDEKKMEVHKNYFSPYMAALSHNIALLLPDDLNYCFFPNSGSEAVEWALKTSFKYHQGNRSTILYSDIAFHGKLFGTESVTNSPENSFPYPKIPSTKQYIFNDFGSLNKLVKESMNIDRKSDVAAIIVEPFNVSNMRTSDYSFIKKLRKLCSDLDIVLIFDEVYSGWCKTGPLFYFLNFKDIVPDILCTAKSLGGGKASIAGLITRKKIFKKAFDRPLDANLQSTTYYGFGEESITALEAVNIVIEEEFEKKSKEIETLLFSRLSDLKSRHNSIIKEFRGSGALFGIFFTDPPNFLNFLVNLIPGELFKDKRFVNKLVIASVVSELYDSHKILTFTSFGKELHLIVSPPLVTELKEIDYFIKCLDRVLKIGILKLVSKFVAKKFPKYKSKSRN